jgi:hypothetical protein
MIDPPMIAASLRFLSAFPSGLVGYCCWENGKFPHYHKAQSFLGTNFTLYIITPFSY